MNGIVLYDCLQVKGGAERVTLDLVSELSGTDLCVGYRVPHAFPEHLIKRIRLYELMKMTSLIGWRTAKQIGVFLYKTNFLSNYDWVIYSGSYAPLAVRNHLKGRNILYCHTIPRFAYDLHDYYLSRMKWWQRPALRVLIYFLKKSYENAIEHMDVIIVNSENVKRRVKTYLAKEAIVIYPPCDIENFKWLGQNNYYLSLARLEPYKRVDLIIEAFKRMPERKLVVASGGKDLPRLRNLATGAANIEFTDWLTESTLRDLLGNAIATIYIPKDEDFGMSPVESMAAGKPVIGVAEGGLLETVVQGETGILLPANPSVEDVVKAVLEMTPDAAGQMRAACEARAQVFKREVFFERIKEVIGI